MNVIEFIRAILLEFPKIKDVCGEINIDFTDILTDSYGLNSMGDTLIEEDVLGNQERQHTFMFYTVFLAYDDAKRLYNSGVLLELSQWLCRQTGYKVTHEIAGETFNGTVTKINTENGMMYAYPQENTSDGTVYQMQIIVNYTLETEEF